MGWTACLSRGSAIPASPRASPFRPGRRLFRRIPRRSPSPAPVGASVKTARLWAPWRVAYLAGTRGPSAKGCLFCRVRRSRSDQKNHLLLRGRWAFAVLNRFPYNNGHLLVVPNRHVARLEALTRAEWGDMHRLAGEMLRRLEKVLAPHGYNLGINIGRAAGAGIPGHLHLHLVPRWEGDTNFMPTAADTKVISQSLDSCYACLRRA